MRKTIAFSLLFALVGVFAMNLSAETAWTTSSCAPSAWTALSNNLLSGQTGTISGSIATSYSTNDPNLLTDGEVPQIADANTVKTKIVGFQGSASVTWTFAAPKTLDQVRVSCGYPVMYQNYSGSRVSAVEVKTFGSSIWTALNTTTGDYADNGQNEIQSLILADGSGAPLAEAVVALRVTFGSPYGLAGYCGEIEAVGSAGAAGPVIGSLEISPAKTRAKVSGLIADAGSDATACDVYLSIDNAEAVKIAKGVAASFEYQLQGLTAGTTYAYTLSVSNNAPTAEVTVRSGDFTTLAADAQTRLWATGEGVPADFSPLANNLLAGMVGTTSSQPSSYGGSVDLLTNSEVSDVTKQTVGFGENVTVAWAFNGPKTVEKIRFTTCYTAGNGMYDDIKVSKIEVKTSASDEWADVGAEAVNFAGSGSSGSALFATLIDVENDFLCQSVTAIRITFGKPNNVAQYYAEIEAVGFAEATGPVVGSLDISPAKTKAVISGTIADLGTDATECDVYLSLDGGAATKIASGVTGSFEYQIQGLTAGTEYAYVFSVSNNASAAKGAVREGTFTTLAADAQTALWTTEDVTPSSWTALHNNLLDRQTGIISGQIATDYSTNDPHLLTDATVPTAAGAEFIVGFQNNASIEWMFSARKTLAQIRVSACYLAGNAYTRLAITGVYVKLANSDSWDALDVPAYSDIGGRSQGVVLCASLSDSEMGYLSQDVVGLKIVFGNVGALASYCAEIEAIGRENKPGLSIFIR